jgi:hypothetical protein
MADRLREATQKLCGRVYFLINDLGVCRIAKASIAESL